MKVMVDTDVLAGMAALPEADSWIDALLAVLADDQPYEMWLSALSVDAVYMQLADGADRDAAARLDDVIPLSAIVPFRWSALHRCLKSANGDYRSRAIVSSAREMNIGVIVSGHPEKYADAEIPAMTPAGFIENHRSGAFDDTRSVPFLDLKAQHHRIYNEIEERIGDIIANTGFILGKHVDEFEKGFADIQESQYALGVSSGTDALHVALAALGIGPGDAVAVPVNTFIATAEAVSLTGATPLFVDCDRYYNMDAKRLAELLAKGESPRVKAILPVHLYGQPADMDAIMDLAERYDLDVLEDACQAHLARYRGTRTGNFGRFGAFSFYPGKNLGAYGEAGALTTNDEALYRKARMIRQHGELQRYEHGAIGHNYRMEAIQGAVLATKLKHIEDWTARRQANAALYGQCLSAVEEVQAPEQLMDAESVYHLYVVQTDRRDDLQKHLGEHGIATGLHYPVPLHLQPAYAHLGHKRGDFPVAERAAARILSLPMYPELRERQIRHVCETIKDFFTR